MWRKINIFDQQIYGVGKAALHTQRSNEIISIAAAAAAGIVELQVFLKREMKRGERETHEKHDIKAAAAHRVGEVSLFVHTTMAH
jgi:hypothetical protein